MPRRYRRVLDHVISAVEGRIGGGRLAVGIDGVDASGKTTFADLVAGSLRDDGVPVIRASIDGFHNPASIRHHSAKADPGLSYYEDSFDYTAMREVLFFPFVEGRPVRTAVFDYRTDVPVDVLPVDVPSGSVLVFDGVFLQRPELVSLWDMVVFLRIDPEEALRRAVVRDGTGRGDEIERRYRERYMPGQERYMRSVAPETHADIVIDTNGVPFIGRSFSR
jgi:uridine kinase